MRGTKTQNTTNQDFDYDRRAKREFAFEDARKDIQDTLRREGIKKTYEQIVKRLKEERVGFDNQLAAIERTLASKQHDYEELLLLSADANHAREVAVQELDRVKGGYEEVKKHRDKELRERQQMAQVKTDMNARIEKREKEKEPRQKVRQNTLDHRECRRESYECFVNNLFVLVLKPPFFFHHV